MKGSFSAAIAALTVVLALPALAQPLPDSVGYIPGTPFPENEEVPTLEEMLAGADPLTGTANPLAEEIQTAQELLQQLADEADAQQDSPYKLAQRFWNLHAGLYNTQEQPNLNFYAEEWPVRANPLIVSFFDATQIRKPNGDQTAWCAAFVNWVLDNRWRDRDVEFEPTYQAGSSTFRNWGNDATSDPKPGDIVVFEDIRAGEEWRGHVGFFVTYDDSRENILVLGGNQRPGSRTNTGEINRIWMKVDGSRLKLNSIRSSADLH